MIIKCINNRYCRTKLCNNYYICSKCERLIPFWFRGNFSNEDAVWYFDLNNLVDINKQLKEIVNIICDEIWRMNDEIGYFHKNSRIMNVDKIFIKNKLKEIRNHYDELIEKYQEEEILKAVHVH